MRHRWMILSSFVLVAACGDDGSTTRDGGAGRDGSRPGVDAATPGTDGDVGRDGGPPAPTADLDLFFRGDNDRGDHFPIVHELDTLFQVLLDPFFMPGIGMNHEPLFVIVRHG